MSNNFNNFDILFQTSTAEELNMYANAIRNIRKGKRTKSQKIQALNDQMKLMNLMFNAGHQAGGNGLPNQLNPTSNDFLQMFHATDVNTLWNEMNIPASKTSSSILGDVHTAWNVMKYLGFTAALDKSINKQNENVDIEDIDDPPLVPIPDAHAPSLQELNRQRAAFFKLRNKRNRVGRRGQALPIRQPRARSATPEPKEQQNADDTHPIIQDLNENKHNDDEIIQQRRIRKRKPKKSTFEQRVQQQRRRLYESSDDESDVNVVNNDHQVDNSFVSEYSNYTPQGNRNSNSNKNKKSKSKSPSKHKKSKSKSSSKHKKPKAKLTTRTARQRKRGRRLMSALDELEADAEKLKHYASIGSNKIDYSGGGFF